MNFKNIKKKKYKENGATADYTASRGEYLKWIGSFRLFRAMGVCGDPAEIIFLLEEMECFDGEKTQEAVRSKKVKK